MICPRCNTRNANGNRFCRGCGRPLEGPVVSGQWPVASEHIRPPTSDIRHQTSDISDPSPSPIDSAVAHDLIDQSRSEHEAGRLQRALELARRAVDLAPGDAHIHSAYGLLLEEAGELEEAARQYQAAISMDPRDKLDRYRLKNLAARLGQVVPGASMGNEARPSGPRRTTGRRSLRGRLGEFRRSRFFWPAAAGVSAAALVLIVGGVWIRPATPAQSVAAAAPAGPSEAQRLVDVGKQQFQLGNYDEAARMFQLALASDPTNSEATYWSDVVRQRLAGIANSLAELPRGTLDLTQPPEQPSGAEQGGPAYNTQGLPASAPSPAPASTSSVPVTPGPPASQPMYSAGAGLRGEALSMSQSPGYAPNGTVPQPYGWAQQYPLSARRPATPPSGPSQAATPTLSQYLQQNPSAWPSQPGPSVQPWPYGGQYSWAPTWGTATRGGGLSVQPAEGQGSGTTGSDRSRIHIQHSASPGSSPGSAASSPPPGDGFRWQQEGYNRRAAGDREGALEAFRKALQAYDSQSGPGSREAAAGLQAVIRQLERGG